MPQRRFTHAIKTVGALVAFTILAGCGTVAESESETVTLRLTDFFPSQHFVEVNGVLPFMERVEELSDGEIQFEHFPGGQLVAGPDSVSGVETGLTDLAYFTLPYSAEDMPLLSVCSLPNAFETAAQGISACDEVLKTEPVKETFDHLGVHYLWGFMMPPYTVQTSEKKVETMEDLRGLKLQSGGGVYSDTLSAIGAVPVEMPGSDVYEGVDRGTIDGASMNIYSVTGYGIAPLLNYSTTGTDTGSLLSGFLVNSETWSQLSPEHQKVIETASRQQQESLTKWLDDNLEAEAEKLESDGTEFTEFQDKRAWDDAVQPVWDKWVPQMEKRGLDGQSVLDAWNRGLSNAGAKP